MNICIVTDNEFIYDRFRCIIKDSIHVFDFYFSSINKNFLNKYHNCEEFRPIKLKNMDDSFFSKYDLFMSLHCKQLFPDNLVNNYRCINVHPGLNPYNRGWFPQVFSIINKKPIGVTIHEMDTELDHGPIIYQEIIDINSYDTSFDVYTRIQEKEIEMLEKYLDNLIVGNYVAIPMDDEGNINYKSDFDELCRIELSKHGTYGEFIDILRATTFSKYDNAYFFDNQGNKVYVSINLKVSKENCQ